jgi:ketosteroid isomerase-like protein
MGDAEVEAVREFFAAWTGGDLKTMLDVSHPDIEARPLLGLLYGTSDYRGHAGIGQWFHDARGLGDRFEIHVEDVRNAGEAEVAFVHLIVREQGSAYDARVAVVCRFRDGRIVSLVGRDADEATEALAALQQSAAG